MGMNGQLSHWYQTRLGRVAYACEQEWMHAQLQRVFGYYLLQLGQPQCVDWLEKSPIAHHYVAICQNQAKSTIQTITCDDELLPIATASVDLVFLPHSLEYHKAPEHLLEEVHRILIPQGRVLILGFNPYANWGLEKFLGLGKTLLPPVHPFHSHGRVKHWLEAMDFELLQHNKLCYCPGTRRSWIISRYAFIEYLGKLLLPSFGNIYGIVARKTVRGLTPIRQDFKKQSVRMKQGVVEPTTRDNIG